MKNDDLNISKEDFKSNNEDYKIEGMLDLIHEYVDITTMFPSFYEIKELKINYKAIAYNEEGFDKLLDLGFPKNKIKEEYVKH